MKNTRLFGGISWAATAAAMALVAAGCKSSGGIDAPPTRLPEVTLRATTAGEVEAVARAFFLDRGYVEAASQHAYEVVFDKPSKRRRSSRALRVRLRLHKQTNDTWRLVGTPMGVESWRSDLESEVVLPQGAGQIQSFLVEIKNRVESGR
jgi:hypothetical protein